MKTESAPHDPSLRAPLIAAGALIAVSIAVTAGVRWSGVDISQPDAPVLMTRSLVFVDRADGGIDVIDAREQRVIETIVGQAGFVRGTLRGLARERHRAGIGATLPFELVAHTDGRLTLIDPSTHRRVDLESFGPTNTAEFAQLFAARPSTARENLHG